MFAPPAWQPLRPSADGRCRPGTQVQVWKGFFGMCWNFLKRRQRVFGGAKNAELLSRRARLGMFGVRAGLGGRAWSCWIVSKQQMKATRLPLFAITVAAVPCPDTPVILTLHWHAFLREKLAEVENAQPVSFKSVPSSALQLNARWEDLVTLDRAALEAAWELGAWDVARAERPSCMRPGADSSEAHRMPACLRRLPVWRARRSGGGGGRARRRRTDKRGCAARLSHVDVQPGAWRHLAGVRRRRDAATRRDARAALSSRACPASQ